MTLNIDSLNVMSVTAVTFCLRVSMFPPIRRFEDIVDIDDWESLYALEALTNPKLREEVGNIDLVPEDQRQLGPGASLIMSAFTHIGPSPTAFTDGSYGVLQTSRSLATAEEDTLFHHERFMQTTSGHESPLTIYLSIYEVDVNGTLYDLRDHNYAEDEALTRQLVRELRKAGALGVIYQSRVDPGGECFALLTPRAATGSRQVGRLAMLWDGVAITDVVRFL